MPSNEIQPNEVNTFLATWLLQLLRSDAVSVKGSQVGIAAEAGKWLELIAKNGGTPAPVPPQ